MPYPNWHSARIRQPGRFVKIRGLWIAQGIMAYGGRLKTDSRGSSKVQSYRFSIKNWTVARAKAWLRKKKIKWLLFEKAIGKK